MGPICYYEYYGTEYSHHRVQYQESAVKGPDQNWTSVAEEHSWTAWTWNVKVFTLTSYLVESRRNTHL